MTNNGCAPIVDGISRVPEYDPWLCWTRGFVRLLASRRLHVVLIALGSERSASGFRFG